MKYNYNPHIETYNLLQLHKSYSTNFPSQIQQCFIKTFPLLYSGSIFAIIIMLKWYISTHFTNHCSTHITFQNKYSPSSAGHTIIHHKYNKALSKPFLILYSSGPYMSINKKSCFSLVASLYNSYHSSQPKSIGNSS